MCTGRVATRPRKQLGAPQLDQGPIVASRCGCQRGVPGTAYFDAMSSAEDFGLSLVILSLVFGCAALIRRWSRFLRKLFMPTAVIGGFLVLGLGPEGLGRLSGDTGVFPQDVFAIWKQLPGVLINVMCAALLLGE